MTKLPRLQCSFYKVELYYMRDTNVGIVSFPSFFFFSNRNTRYMTISSMLQLKNDSNYAFPTGSVYGFGKKRRKRKRRKRKRRKRKRRRTPTISESARNIKILHVTHKAGLFHILFGLIKF